MKLCHSFVQRYTKKVGKYRGNKWGDTWKIRVNPNGHTVGFAMTLDSCPLYEFAKKRGYMDVLPWMCATDQRVARAMHAHLIRHKTISSGDNCCEYWYVGDTSRSRWRTADQSERIGEMLMPVVRSPGQ